MKHHIANIITSSRILFSVWLIFTQLWSPVFWCLYLVCGVSDMVDGEIARRTHTESRLGAMLDSIADICLVMVCMVVMLPHLDIPVWVWTWAVCIMILKLVNLVSGYVCYHKIVMLHNRANRLIGFLLFLLPMADIFIPLAIPAFAVCVVATFAALQEGHIILTRGIAE